MKAAMGWFVPRPAGGGGATAMSTPAAQATIEFSSKPSPPRKGDNVFQVKVTGSGGTSVAGAQVTITFYMPAIPAMGMAAMRTVATLTEKGNGMYERSCTLQTRSN